MSKPSTAAPGSAPAAGRTGAESQRLPDPGPAALAHAAQLQALIDGRIADAGGWLRFDAYMDLALYAPGLGYYAAGARKFGAEGDFVTAPEISPLFGRALAFQAAQVLGECGGDILEFGAGTGALAHSLLAGLARISPGGQAAHRYFIVETSPDLRARQQERLAGLPVQWLDAPPSSFTGMVIANEVLDVMPVRLFVRTPGGVLERGVESAPGGGFRFALRPAGEDLLAAVTRIESAAGVLPGDYGSEWCPVAQAWVHTLGDWLQRGAALLIDYGFPQREYYHPQRLMGTLMCHFRHRAHADPLWLAGLNDITAHVDFTAIADAALDCGLEVLGYTSQAHFLINCGLLDLLKDDPGRASTSAVHRLISEAEMGELLKVMALGRGLDESLVGFARGDRRERL